MKSATEIIAELSGIYEAAVATLRDDILAFATHGTLPPADRRAKRAWSYPELRIRYAGWRTKAHSPRR